MGLSGFSGGLQGAALGVLKVPLEERADPFEDIIGGTPEENARDFNALLDGTPSAYRDAVLLNSAAALVVADAAPDLKAGVEMARHSIDSGAARDKITQVARITQTA